jgi:signal transduction histidine kinase/ligand-binding sensor domain-containing protein
MITARVILCVAAVLYGESTALAQRLPVTISQYAHTAWRTREGFAKGTINTIAQTTDGYLWLGTDYALLRFDGVNAVEWQPPQGERLPSNDIYGLLAARDGALWIGTSRGLAKWKDGTLTKFDAVAGDYVYALLEDRDATIWVGTIAVGNARLCAIAATRIECDGGNGRFGNVITSLHEDNHGRIWAAVVGGVWRWKPGPPQFYAIPGAGDNIQSFVPAEDGALITGPDKILRFNDGATRPYSLGVRKPFRPQRLLRDRHGGLWIGTIANGVIHVAEPQTDVFTAAQGLSGDNIFWMLEDREGSIWLATSGGLDRFREVAVPTFSVGPGTPNAHVASVVAMTDGSIWYVANGVLNRRLHSQVTVVATEDGTSTGKPIGVPTSLLQDRRGRLWVATTDGFGYFRDGRFTRLRTVPARSPVHDMTEDADGTVWVASQDHGLLRVSGDGAVVARPWAAFNRQDFASAMIADPARHLWIGFQTGGLIQVAADRVQASYTPGDGLGVGRVNSLRFDRHGALWASTEGGLSRLRNGRIATLAGKNGLPCDGVHWAIEDDAQSAWLLMPCGLVRVPLADLETWAADVDQGRGSSRAVRTTMFNSSDGVTLRAFAGGFSPQVTKSADGKIWFASQDGISMIDPRHLPSNQLPPPVTVERLSAAGQVYDEPAIAAGIQLPALTRDLQIDYTALSLVAPDRMQFRYQLEGHDPSWQHVGTRRQAYYSDLAPGTYRFKVTASNNNGVWNTTGANVQFTIAPAYYQTAWFLALVLGAAAAVVWSAHRVRLRVVERHEQEISALNERLMKAQEQERIRIAGELHDGVMQQMLAMSMMLGTAKRRIADDSEARPTLEKISEKLVEVGSDIRRLSHDLHPPILQEAGLPQAVRTYCEQFSTSSGIAVSCEADDAVQELSRGAALALFRIMQEALGNAAKHARASQIDVRLARANGNVTLTVTDNGVGFERSRLATLGGLGLVTMRERAGQLNGTFELETAPGRGTTIRVSIPFR